MNKEMEGLSLAAVKGNTAYVQWYNEEGSTRLYSVNVKQEEKSDDNKENTENTEKEIQITTSTQEESEIPNEEKTENN